ncbi:TorF family putative porin [Sphingomonas sp. Y38-1Y]|uniref:TorF family putative porin n=1 Tax=Sphingomonas sp. Y38-1Y TaxID=3078265 RepID=UPI0028E9D699|nr:TorF family putative porin [Sphingomonas sp. Y38-1Y]
MLAIASAGAGVGVGAPAAQAQELSRPTASIEATTDHRRRGLSWSDGDPALDAIVSVPLAGLRVDARATTTRGAIRHDGADMVFDGSASYSRDLASGLSLTGGVTGHFFAGAASKADYGELDLTLGYALGPLQLDLGGSYAPKQDAIGGDNLYLQARASGSIPLTGIEVAAHVGRTSGSTDDLIRAARLRPEGMSYVDWGVRVEQRFGPLALGLRYSGTDIDTDAVAGSPFADLDDAGHKLTAHAAVFF